MEDKDLKVVSLPDNLHLMDQCVDLLNSQWPRSKTARLRSLVPGIPRNLPISLLLITRQGKQGEVVIGHSKIQSMPQNKDACFVTSVVIQKNLRGKGLGRLLMEKTEDFARVMDMKSIFLSTFDQQDFYGKLGYELYDYNPVVIYGGKTIALTNTFDDEGDNSAEQVPSKTITPHLVNSNIESKSKAPPPPPPPLPKITILTNSSQSELRVHMRKLL